MKGIPTEMASGILPGCEIPFCPSKVLRRNQKKPKRVRKRKEKGRKQQQKKGRSPRKLLRKVVRRRRRRRKRKRQQERKRAKARRRLDLRAAFHQSQRLTELQLQSHLFNSVTTEVPVHDSDVSPCAESEFACRAPKACSPSAAWFHV